MNVIERLKKDIVKHRGRAAILGTLAVIMAVMTTRAIIEMRPPQVAAAVISTSTANPEQTAASGADAEERIKQSKILWHSLREVKPNASSAAVAFAFDPAFYPAPLIPIAPAVDPSRHADPDPKPIPVAPAVDPEAIKLSRIREQSHTLVVKTTAVGNGSNPMAIVNQQLLTVGQEINGFEIAAIRAREVEFVKEGVSVVVKMPEGQ